VDIGVLEEYYSSEWASPSFEVPKKNGRNTIRVVTDFSKLNFLKGLIFFATKKRSTFLNP
jgi:hypothetical protein